MTDDLITKIVLMSAVNAVVWWVLCAAGVAWPRWHYFAALALVSCAFVVGSLQ